MNNIIDGRKLLLIGRMAEHIQTLIGYEIYDVANKKLDELNDILKGCGVNEITMDEMLSIFKESKEIEENY